MLRSTICLTSVVLGILLSTSLAFAQDAQTDDSTMLDATHEDISSGLQASVQWFDEFFSDERALEAPAPRFSLQLSAELRKPEGPNLTVQYRARARVTLPRLTRRLNLVISTEAQRQQIQDDTLGEFYNAAVALNEQASFLGLRYFIVEDIVEFMSIDSGLKIKAPPDPYVSVRYRREGFLCEEVKGRLTQTVRWSNEDRASEVTRADIERELHGDSLLRLTAMGTYGESTEGLEWLYELSLYDRVGQHAAVSYSLSHSGLSRPAPDSALDTYRAAVGYRQSIWRPWFFINVTPEFQWPRYPGGQGRLKEAALILRLEVNFNQQETSSQPAKQ